MLRCLRIDREVRPSRHALPGASVKTFEEEVLCILPKRKKPNYRTQPYSDVFTCRICGWPIGPEGAGSQHRKHCPNCLSSVHLDDEPGDRAARCGGTMEPVTVWVRKGGEWAVIHRCKVCGVLHSNRVAADDNPALLMSLAVKPLAEPPFPLSRLKDLL